MNARGVRLRPHSCVARTTTLEGRGEPYMSSLQLAYELRCTNWNSDCSPSIVSPRTARLNRTNGGGRKSRGFSLPKSPTRRGYGITPEDRLTYYVRPPARGSVFYRERYGLTRQLGEKNQKARSCRYTFRQNAFTGSVRPLASICGMKGHGEAMFSSWSFSLPPPSRPLFGRLP